MSDATVNPQQPSNASPRWQPLGSIDRRVVGVLAEKAKTTPDIYPMSLNAICAGCNQKSNREPQMQLEPEDVEESLERLRGFGAVGLVEGYGRVSKYRHYLYDWLGVDKVELAVMTELLLRGDQTVGDLRARASRMEPIPDQATLKNILDSLKQKKLVISLTSEGRGHVVSHGLYKPREIELLQTKYSGVRPSDDSASEERPIETGSSHPAFSQSSSVAAPASPSVPFSSDASPALSKTQTVVHAPNAAKPEIEALRRDFDALKTQFQQLQQSFEESLQEQHRLGDELRALKDALGA